jgi:hypothetical protein
MKAVDYFLRSVTIVVFIALLVSPNKWGFPLLLFTFAAIGVWALLYPPGIIGWARTAYPRLDPGCFDLVDSTIHRWRIRCYDNLRYGRLQLAINPHSTH